MSKYSELGVYLSKQSNDLVPMSFADIERVIGDRLPNSRRYPAWWSNNPWNNTMTKVWLEAGFVSEQVDIEGQKVVFRRIEEAKHGAADASPRGRDLGPRPRLLGCMKGTVVVPEGVDLTAPADPHWSELADLPAAQKQR